MTDAIFSRLLLYRAESRFNIMLDIRANNFFPFPEAFFQFSTLSKSPASSNRPIDKVVSPPGCIEYLGQISDFAMRHEEIRMLHICAPSARLFWSRDNVPCGCGELHLVKYRHASVCAASRKRGHASSILFGIRDWRVSMKNIGPARIRVEHLSYVGLRSAWTKQQILTFSNLTNVKIYKELSIP